MKTRPAKASLALFIGVLLLSLSSMTSIIAQPIFNAGFGIFQFTAANKNHMVGTDGSMAGDVTLYKNVITIGGQPIDCIVRTVSITNGKFELPQNPVSGTIPFDYSASQAGAPGPNTMNSNQDRFFAPTFNFGNGGGNAKFKFEFILGGSYNNATSSGTKVVLQNVRLNTYDIDGSGSGTNQFNEFGGFAAVTVGNPTNISQSYNTNSGLTKFRAIDAGNEPNVTDPRYRIQVDYSTVSDFEIIVGSEGSGRAYFFLDFSNPPFTNSVTYTTPGIDLNTLTPGIGNANGACSGTKRFTNGAGNANITSSSGAIDELIISYDRTMIQNGNSEVLFPKGNLSTVSDSIRLGFTGNVVSESFNLSGVTFSIVRTVVGLTNTIRFRRSPSGSLTTAQAEMLLDSLYYQNTALTPSVGSRIFNVSIREGSFTSPIAVFDLSEICILPVRWLGFNAIKDAKGQLKLDWQVADDANATAYQLEYSRDGMQWLKLGQVDVNENSSHTGRYTFHSMQSFSGLVYFRIRQIDLSGQYGFSAVRFVEFSSLETIRIWPNPAVNQVQVEVKESSDLELLDQFGSVFYRAKLRPGYTQYISLEKLPKGVYIMRFLAITGSSTIKRLVKQ